MLGIKRKRIGATVGTSLMEQATQSMEAQVFARLLASQPPPPLPLPEPPARPEPYLVTDALTTDALAEYVAVANEIGLESGALLRAKFLNFLQREEIPLFDYKRVQDFMNGLVRGKASPQGYQVVWVWKGLRAQDVTPNHWGDAHGYSNGGHHSFQYNKAVPLDVLRTVAKVAKEFPTATFHVTDYDVHRPDPFLGVKLPGIAGVFVIAVWDEPDFKIGHVSRET